jgi:hypothetical protein
MPPSSPRVARRAGAARSSAGSKDVRDQGEWLRSPNRDSRPLARTFGGPCHAFLRYIRGTFEAEAVGEVVRNNLAAWCVRRCADGLCWDSLDHPVTDDRVCDGDRAHRDYGDRSGHKNQVGSSEQARAYMGSDVRYGHKPEDNNQGDREEPQRVQKKGCEVVHSYIRLSPSESPDARCWLCAVASTRTAGIRPLALEVYAMTSR